jgi:hypothetical protein
MFTKALVKIKIMLNVFRMERQIITSSHFYSKFDYVIGVKNPMVTHVAITTKCMPSESFDSN